MKRIEVKTEKRIEFLNQVKELLHLIDLEVKKKNDSFYVF